MRIIVDTNRLMSAAIKSGTTREILLSGRFEFYTIEHALLEIKLHKKHVALKSGLSNQQLDDLFDLLMGELIIVDDAKVMRHMREAQEIMGKIDPSDAPFIACAFSVNAEAIWTHDKHFQKQKKVLIVSNNEIMGLL